MRGEDLTRNTKMRAEVKVQESEVEEGLVWDKRRDRAQRVSAGVKSRESEVQEIQTRGKMRGKNLCFNVGFRPTWAI